MLIAGTALASPGILVTNNKKEFSRVPKLKIEDSKLNFVGIDTFRFGLERFDSKIKNFRFKNTEADKAEVQKGIDKVITLYKKNYFLIVADELITCMNSGLVDDKVVQKLVDECPKDTHLLLTGRGATDWLIEKADLVSDVKEVKHYFKDGEGAIKGLDY